MRVAKLELQNFRNYERAAVSFGPRVNIITGENAQGKTNLLEAIYFFSAGRSFRAARGERDLIRFGQQQAALKMTVDTTRRQYELEAQLRVGTAKRLSVNGVRLQTRGELGDVMRCVLFSPEDLSLVRDGAAARRRFLNQSLCQLRPRYFKALSEYNKLYDHKTRILRDWERKPDLLQVLDDFSVKMAYYGAILIHYRARMVERLAPYAATFSADCSGGQDAMALRYETVSGVFDALGELQTIVDELIDHAMTHKQAELAARQCLSGPHKDDLVVTLGGVDARKFASQGQARTTALALKLAEREVHKEEFGEYPILLLDDVLSELDDRRQAFVRERIGEGQVFITCCTNEGLEDLTDARILQVKQGTVT